MHAVIMGCGRVGASLAEQLDSAGHSVAVVDQDPDAFRRLGDDFSGRQVKGVGFDRDTLQQAGIEDAYAFAAVSSGASGASIHELTLPDGSPVVGHRVGSLDLGPHAVLAAVMRSGTAYGVEPDLTLEAGDELLLVLSAQGQDDLDQLQEQLAPRAKERAGATLRTGRAPAPAARGRAPT